MKNLLSLTSKLLAANRFTTDSQYVYWDKKDNPKLSEHFWGNEFRCKCAHKTCTRQRISRDLIRKLESIRGELEQPISIHSGYRCEQHQKDIAASGAETATGTSTHELGQAADISAKSMNELRRLVADEFKAIGLANSFIHVDMRADKVRRWSYSKV